MKYKGSTQKIDLIGDIHGHYLELRLLLEKLGYSLQGKNLAHPDNRKLAFVGDFINRGPQSIEVLKLVRSLHQSGDAFVVLGNHEFNLIQNLVAGNSIPDEFVLLFHGLELSLSFSNLKLSALCMPLGTFHPLNYPRASSCCG